MEPNQKIETVRMVVDPNIINEGKNTQGQLGEKCNNCGGYGFTLSLNGSKLLCKDCEGLGVKMPTKIELQKQINDIKDDLTKLKQALLDTLEAGGIPVPHTVKEATNE